jgi:hypothetical protein
MPSQETSPKRPPVPYRYSPLGPRLGVNIGAVRYPGLPAARTQPGWAVTRSQSFLSIFAVVAGQLHFTVLWTGCC